MSFLSMTVTSIDNVLAHLEQVEREKERSIAALVTASTLYAQRIAMEHTPVKTGRLRRGNKVRQSRGGTRYIIINELYNTVPYAGYVCWGTRYMRGRDFLTPAIVAGRTFMENGLQTL